MVESVQAYYEKLIARQAESIRTYLVKYELTEWDKLSPTLTNNEREYILNGYSKGIIFNAVSFFRTIITKAQLKEAVQGNKESSKEVFECLFGNLSIRAQHVLLYNDINCVDDLAPWIEGKEKNFLRYRNCGRRTSEELMEMVSSLRDIFVFLCLTSDDGVSESQGGESRCQNEEIVEDDDASNTLGNTFASNGNHIQIQKRFEQLIKTLSVRARNVLFDNRIVNVEDFLALTSKPVEEIMKYRNCGKKTALEFLEAKNRLQLLILGIETIDEELLPPFEGAIHFNYEEQKKLSAFKKEHGHWPMVFVLYSKIKSLLKPRELAAFENRFGIWKHDELEGLSKYGVQLLFERAVKRLRDNSSFKQLCDYKDWDLYYVNDIPFPVFNNNNRKDCVWLEIEQMITKEKLFLDAGFHEMAFSEGGSKEQSEVFFPINLSTFKAFLRFWGHLPLWWNKNSLVPYCPWGKRDCCDSNSPIVIDKRFAAFKFNRAVKEIERLQKIKTVNDITISIERYFIDNEVFWHKKVDLTNEDKVALLCILKELFGNNCSAYVVDDNLLLKANRNRNDYGAILYEILSKEGARLHRDELLKRLKKTCDEMGLRCDFSHSSQMIPYLVKDSRITSFGKSGYWGLKEWGDSYGSIRELALRFVGMSMEPIHIDDLTKLIMESRPDSNEKSISAIIRQTTLTGELLLFYGDYIGRPKERYAHDYQLMPRTFDEWFQAFRDFVLKNKRFPNNDKDFEGFLYRWFKKAIKLTGLSSEEMLKIDALEKELAHYPHNKIEYNFLHNCNMYKMFVEGNNRTPQKEDDPDLYTWFYTASKKYNSYKDNRKKYFSQLLQYLSAKLY